MNDKEAIREVVAALATYVDARDWDKLKHLFASEVDVDYSSLFGGEKEHIEIDVLIARWSSFLPTFTGTVHMIGTPVIELHFDSARAYASVVGWHAKGDMIKGTGSMWVVGGHYEIGLTKLGGSWRISELTLQALFQEGSPS